MSAIPPDLTAEARAARELIAWLRAQGADDESVELSIASETDLHEAAGAVLDTIAAADAMLAGVKERIEALRAREARLKLRQHSLRAALVRAIGDAGLSPPRLALPEATLSVVPGKPRVTVLDEAVVPLGLMREKVTRAPDLTAIAAELDAGRPVAGCALSNAMPSLRISRR